MEKAEAVVQSILVAYVWYGYATDDLHLCGHVPGLM